MRDVSYDEDRLHGCQIGRLLVSLRNAAINILRREGYPYVPDAWRDIASHPGFGIHLLRLTGLIL